MNKLLNTSYEKVIHALVPGFVRGPVMIKWLLCLAAPLAYIRDKLKEYRLESNRSIMVTGQTLSLVNHLNDLFDPNQRRIEIQDSGLIKQDYLFNAQEGITEVFGYNQNEEPQGMNYITNISETGDITDYSVLLPEGVFATQEEKVREIVARYNILNRTFYIQNIEA